MGHAEEDSIKQLTHQEFLDGLYGYAYRRCSSAQEAEDLCSDIILSVLASLRRNPPIDNFNAYVWTIAHRVYADFCKKRRKRSEMYIADGYSDDILNVTANPVDDYLELDADHSQLRSIMREISFLSKIYRDVMVLYYLDELKTSHIAEKLGITETTVKQRLFSARNTIKKEAEKMDTNYALKPVHIVFIGNGSPVGNDPRSKAERVLSKNVLYLCKNTALTAKEISEKLGVPTLFIEDEINIQLKGENGDYGLLRMLDNGKYISNILILDTDELAEGSDIFTKYLNEFCVGLKTALEANKDKILSFPFLSKQDNIHFILWSLIKKIALRLDFAVQSHLEKDPAFEGIEPPNRPFTLYGLAVKQGESYDSKFYGIDGIQAESIEPNKINGYLFVNASNVYGKRISKHFACEHNILTDPLLMLTLRCIGGLKIAELTDAEKEHAAKALECGYLSKENDSLIPRIVVISTDTEKEFYDLLSDFAPSMIAIAKKIASELGTQIRKHVPKHLMNEYYMYSMAAATGLEHDVIEYCISEGILTTPESRLCPEGVLLKVKK